MKRNKSNINLTKKVRPSTSTEHENTLESGDESMEEVTVIKQCNYKTYFKYETRNNEKVGVCLLCQKQNVTKELKMKNGNTTGLKKHLERNHEKAYEHLFGPKAIKRKTLIEKQKTMDVFLNVSIEIKFYKLCIKYY